MENLINWIVELNRSNHAGFGILTVGTMTVIGIIIAIVAELIFKALGIKSDKIEIQH